MNEPVDNLEQACARAAELYEAGIRQTVEAEHKGEYLILNLDTGDYVLGTDWLQVSDAADLKFAKAPRFLLRVGYPSAVRIGFRAAI